MMLSLRCVSVVTALLSVGCGLVPPDPVDFHTYPLRDTTYQEAERVVREVTKEWFTTRFGGIAIRWDDVGRNLKVDSVELERRRMTLYIHLVPMKNGADVEMLALVEHLVLDGGGVGWQNPLMDVHLEKILHQAFVDEIVRRRIKANASP